MATSGSPRVFGNNIGRVTLSTLAAEDASVDAHAVSGTTSNVNGVFEPGETVEVSPAWHNTAAGAQSVAGTAASLTGPAGPTYTIDDASATYGTIAGGGTADCHDATGDCYRSRSRARGRSRTGTRSSPRP